MHVTGKGNIYDTENPGIGKANAFTSLLGSQGILIPRLGYSPSRKTPL